MWPFWRFLESMNVLGKMGRSQEKERKKERKKEKNPTPSIKCLVLGSCCRLYFIIIKFLGISNKEV
jgi:hypothetical protein